MKYAVIADVAGQYEALMRLIKRIPSDYELVFLGDLCDRGPDSDLVFEFVINGGYKCVLANHEDMMYDYYRCPQAPSMYGTYRRGRYDDGIWLGNGGHATFGRYTQVRSNPETPRSAHLLNKHLDWIADLPYRLDLPMDNGEFTILMVSHAPLHQAYPDDHQVSEKELNDWGKLDGSLLWNRSSPRRRRYFQLNGHNSHWGLIPYSDDNGTYGWCLDDSRKSMLTAMLMPDQTIIQESYTFFHDGY